MPCSGLVRKVLLGGVAAVMVVLVLGIVVSTTFAAGEAKQRTPAVTRPIWRRCIGDKPDTIRPHSSLGYRPPAPTTQAPWMSAGTQRKLTSMATLRNQNRGDRAQGSTVLLAAPGREFRAQDSFREGDSTPRALCRGSWAQGLLPCPWHRQAHARSAQARCTERPHHAGEP